MIPGGFHMQYVTTLMMDELGRFALPEALLEQLHIHTGQAFNVYLGADGIVYLQPSDVFHANQQYPI